MASDELYHFGVKGMHWYIRRTPEQLGHKPSSKKKKTSSSSTKPKTSPKKKKSPTKEQIRKTMKKGKRFIDSISPHDVKKIAASAAVVASGGLWVASAFATGGTSVMLNGAAAVANLSGILLNNNR